MSKTHLRVVYDCVVFLQGLGRRNNASRRCLEFIFSGIAELCLSPDVLYEIADVLSRPELLRKFPLIQSVDSINLLRAARNKAMLYTSVPPVFRLPRDPDDQIYTDLAIEAEADFLVSWNERHLNYLMLKDSPEGIEFCNKYPSLRIVTPPQFIIEVTKHIPDVQG